MKELLMVAAVSAALYAGTGYKVLNVQDRGSIVVVTAHARFGVVDVPLDRSVARHFGFVQY
jgi:hypothetical protein